MPKEFEAQVNFKTFEAFCKNKVLAELRTIHAENPGKSIKRTLQDQLTGKKESAYLPSEAVSAYVGLSYRQGNRLIAKPPEGKYVGGLFAWGGVNYSLQNITASFLGSAAIILKTIKHKLEPVVRKGVLDDTRRQETLRKMKEVYQDHPLVFLDYVSNDFRDLWTEYLTDLGLKQHATDEEDYLHFEKMLTAHTHAKLPVIRKQGSVDPDALTVTSPLQKDPEWALEKRQRGE